ncbi:HtaA domain-containing protein [Streptomyces thinghirensis]|nr:HtaA domain-containing protein [Streptomyces thinghirensis]
MDSKDAEITADVTRGGTTEDDVPLAAVTVTHEMTDMATTLTEEAAEVFGSASYNGAAGDPLTVVRKAPPAPVPRPPRAPPTTEPSPTANADADPGPGTHGHQGRHVRAEPDREHQRVPLRHGHRHRGPAEGVR